MTCECEKTDQKCFFRYDDVYFEKSEEDENEGGEVVFTLNYIYGNGLLYSKIVTDSELNNIPKGKNIIDIFPTLVNYQQSTLTSNQRHYLKVEVKILYNSHNLKLNFH